MFALKCFILPFLAAPLLMAGAAEGKAVYEKRCRACHGADGKGNPAIAKAQKVEFRALSSKEVQAKSDDELKKAMLGGTPKKKPVSGLTDAQVKDVLAYVRSMAAK